MPASHIVNEPFATHIRDFGLPKDAVPCSPEIAEGLRGRLPDGLVAMWQEVGIGIVRDGRFQFCPPDYLQPVIDMAVGHDPELGGSMVTPFGYSAFGLIYGWHSTLGRCDIDVLDKEIVTSMPETERERGFKPHTKYCSRGNFISPSPNDMPKHLAMQHCNTA